MSEFTRMLVEYTVRRPVSANWNRAVIEFLAAELNKKGTHE